MATLSPKERQIVLLAATVALTMAEAEGVSTEDSASNAWTRTGHPHLRAVAWNPRQGSTGWRLAGRLDNHKGSRPDGT